MEWLKKLLESQGLSEEQVKAITEGAKDEKFIPKSRLDEVIEQKKELEKQIVERDTQLTELNKKVKGNEELEKTIADLQIANATAKTDYDNKLREITLNASIQSKLTETKYGELLATKIDRSKLVVNADGTIIGLDEQVATIKETYKDLFTPTVTGNDPNKRGRGASSEKNPWSKEHFNLTEQGKLLKDNPELAKQLMASK